MKKLYLTLILVIILASIAYSADLVNDMAADIGTDTSSFDGILSATEDEVQKALDILDDCQDKADFTEGSVLFRGSSVITEDNSNLFWDNANKTLGISDSSPLSELTIKRGSPASSSSGQNMLDVRGRLDDSTDTTFRGAYVLAERANTSGASSRQMFGFISFATDRGTQNLTHAKYGLVGQRSIASKAVSGGTVTTARAIIGRVNFSQSTTGTITSAVNLFSEGIDAEDGIITNAYSLYAQSNLVDTGTLTNNYGIWLEDQTAGGTINAGIVLDGNNTAGASISGLGAATIYGDGQDAATYYDDTDYVIDPKLVGTGGVRILGDTFWTGDGSGVPYGEIYAKDNAVTTTLNNSGKVQITVFDVNGVSNLSTPDHTNDHITIDKAGVYMSTISIAVLNSAGAGHLINVGLFKNNGTSQFLNVHGHRTLSAGTDKGSITLSGLIDVDVNDTIELWANTDSGTDRTVIFEDITLSLSMVGGT